MSNCNRPMSSVQLSKRVPGLGSKEEPWNAEKIFKEAKHLYFPDWPTPKASSSKHSSPRTQERANSLVALTFERHQRTREKGAKLSRSNSNFS